MLKFGSSCFLKYIFYFLKFIFDNKILINFFLK
jgi:hypothetical protein